MNNSLWKQFKEKYDLHIESKYYRNIVTMTLLISTIAISTGGISLASSEVMDEHLTKGEIKAVMKEDLSYFATAYAIKVNGKEVAYLESEVEAKEALKEYKEKVIEDIDSNTEKLKKVDVLEDVTLIKKRIPAEKLEKMDSTVSTITKIETGNIEEKKHVIKGEENFWTLSMDYGVSVEDIEKANPNKDTKKLKDGDEVIIPVAKPLLTVRSKEEEKIEEEVDFDVEYIVDDQMYEGKEEVRVEGEKGKVEKEIQIERYNGKEVAKEVVSESIVKEPINMVIAKGTKEMPQGISTGVFNMPTRGSITSTYGHRWGRLHGGLDIGANIGEPIVASDGGVVKYAQFNNGGYGNMVEIDHGNGIVTRYAHCSELNVNVGDRVNQGDTIAAVGNTGRSTGPHLHFEVRINGNPENPQDYLK